MSKEQKKKCVQSMKLQRMQAAEAAAEKELALVQLALRPHMSGEIRDMQAFVQLLTREAKLQLSLESARAPQRVRSAKGAAWWQA